MRLRRVLPAFVLGLSLGLLGGIAFFVFKVNDLFNRMKDSAGGNITVIEQRVKDTPDVKRQKEKDQRLKIAMQKPPKPVSDQPDSLLLENEEINVATDVLLSVKTVKVIRIGDKISEPDSLAAKLASVEEISTEGYVVEFWKTPLNSRGYRFTKNKLMLYGFMDYNNVILYELDNVFYLKSSDQVYRLNFNADFQQPERVLDSELLSRLS
jgi:hypothetical protein